MKSHDMDVKLGEGLNMGAVHTAHKKVKVVDAKHNGAPQKMALMENEKHEMGGADPMGGWKKK